MSIAEAGPLDLEVVVPARNEADRLGPTLVHMAAYLAGHPGRCGIAVVDNGSVDRTAEVVTDLAGTLPVPIRLIACARPGKGAAVRSGILSSSARYVGYCDAELALPIELLDEARPALERGRSVVVASRRCPGASCTVRQPRVRRIAGRAFRLAVWLCLPELAGVSDTQCGLKFFEGTMARRLFAAATASGFAFDVEILGLALLADCEILELPVRWEHLPGSQVRILRHASRVMLELVRIRRNLHLVRRNGLPNPPARPLPDAVGT